MIIDGVRVEIGLLIDNTFEMDRGRVDVDFSSAQTEFSSMYDALYDDGEKVSIAYIEEDYWLLDGSFIMPNGDINLIKDYSFEDGKWEEDNEFAKLMENGGVNGGRYYRLYTDTPPIAHGGIHYSPHNDYDTVEIIENHKYYIGCYVSFYTGYGDEDEGVYFYIGNQGIFIKRFSDAVNNWKFVGDIITADNGNVRRSVKIEAISLAGRYTDVDDVVLIDLTELFGAGMEPSVEDCNLMFAGGFEKYKVGYESAKIWDRINRPIAYIDYKFAYTHDSFGITMRFPKTSVVKNFSVSYYKGEEKVNEIKEDSNVNSFYEKEFTALQWSRIYFYGIEPSKRQRARIQSIKFGIRETYNEDKLIEVSANKVLNVTADYADSGEAKFTFFNDGGLDIQNIKDLTQNVIDRTKMQVYIRKQFENEYKLFGTYYAENGKVSENGRIVSLNGHDGLYKLDDIDFTIGKVYPNGRSLADWAREVADFAGVKIEISSAFEKIISKGYIDSVPCREALRMIAEAGHGMLGIDENDIIHIWSYDDIVTEKGTIGNDIIVHGSLSLNNENKNVGVKVTEYSFTLAEAPKQIAKVEKFVLKKGLQTVELNFSITPISDDLEIIVPFGDVYDIEIQSNKVIFKVGGERNDDITNIVVMATPYETVTNVVERGETKKDVKEIINNYLITDGIANDVADYQLKHAVKKYEYEFETVTENDIELGGTYEIQKNNVIVTDVGFDISYDDQNEFIKGVDK